MGGLPAEIAPTVTAETPEEYQRQMTRLANFASRVHIDVADGILAPTKLLPIDRVWWPPHMAADVHVMYKRPFEHTNTLVQLRPQLVIVHAEAEGDFLTFADAMHTHGIRVGVALLVPTKPQLILGALPHIDHVLIFAGHLGYQGGKANLKMLHKIEQLRKRKSGLEISWDGGVNDKNARRLISGGVDVLNVGGFIGKAVNPYAAYVTLQTIAEGTARRNGK